MRAMGDTGLMTSATQAGAAAASGAKTAVADPVGTVMQGLAQFIAVAARVISDIADARNWTISEQKLGERFIDQLPGVHVALFNAGLLDYSGQTYELEHPGWANWVDSHFGEGKGSYGTIIPMAQKVMTLLFGVRITNGEDLDALDVGPDEYYRRPDKQDIPLAAVQRAVTLKQNYFPISTYNTKQWDLSKFATIQYVAPIPGIQPNTFFNGEIPGGGKIVEGIVTVPGVFTPAEQSGGSLSTESTGASPTGSTAGTAGSNKFLIGALLVLGLIALTYERK